ncbi:uncharacterized protein THITE_130193 [Thermothielavioides terrestris NRRL 8126]|uniref:Subtelomeric hrmA-associated cluster protein AFUB-079030/YDR124W-like helical bundle domain-containing protein n=1 Tax=Thermothielavioides terrestris (strain ATCC 38088 / NRRL 8126) TaxID=578455 RepID=G2RAC5_THETT|nr:uncharacterized protein THITE_130193 [Thermothielavioides terrestris NRRL 8126]AEO68857.1 hypothetical protein THITE_130193 [Thermothielavioides terrestris NRRL 8126]
MVTVNANDSGSYSRHWGTDRHILDHDALRIWYALYPYQRTAFHWAAGGFGETLTATQTVARALREQCNIHFESFFLAIHQGKGNFLCFSGPHTISEEDIRQIFRREKFLQFQNLASPRERLSRTHEDDDYQDTNDGRYVDDQWAPQPKRRKRTRRPGAARGNVDDDVAPIVVSSRRAIEIGDSEAVRQYYEQCFKCLQQTACKIIAKYIIKLIAPKKQANNPYTRGDATAPAWWPKPWGTGEKDKVRHVEPDHQWKKERIYLLTHIIKLVVDPEKQPPEMRRLGINVAKLETVAMESLSSFFEDPSKPKNEQKKYILKELFKLAKMEEKYLRNEIDGTTQVFVPADDMLMNYYFDEDDKEEDEGDIGELKAERARTDSLASSGPSPGNAMLASLPPPSTNALTAELQATSFLHNSAAVRNHQYGAPAMIPSDLAPEQYAFSNAAGGLATTMAGPTPPPLQPHTTAAALQLHQLLGSPLHHQHQQPHHDSANRRSPLFAAPTTEFSASPTTALYHNSPWETQSSPAQDTPSTTAASSNTSSSNTSSSNTLNDNPVISSTSSSSSTPSSRACFESGGNMQQLQAQPVQQR